MIGIDCLCFVTPKGELNGSPCVGVTKSEKSGKGQYLLDLVVRPGAKVQISALPVGWIYDAKNTDQGFLVRLFDTTGRPNDHGFVLKVEAPKMPATPPVPEFATTVRGELGPAELASEREPILAETAAPPQADDDAPTTTTEEEPNAGDDAGSVKTSVVDEDEPPPTRGGSSSSSSSKRRR